MIKALISGTLAAVMLAGCATLATNVAQGSHDYPEATSYDVSEDASGDVDAALERAGESGKRVLLVMGANWCHDSRALAGWLQTPRFKTLVSEKYELVFVNVGMPQKGDGHNLGIAKRFGLDDLPGTPNVLVLTPEGELLNADTATTWRDAASREEDAIYDELAALASKAT
ncbi:MAG: thioredoxin family protein [Erythrobacter sp.]